MQEIQVQPIAPEEFRVRVTEDGTSTTHLVRVSSKTRARYSPHASGQRLVEESFRFLLERERKETISHSFELPLIDRLYPEYRDEIARRLGEAG